MPASAAHDGMISSTAKKFRLLRTWTAGYPMWCAWQVTYRCNFRCGFCGCWRHPAASLPEQPTELFARASRKLDRLGSLFVSLAGGEPLMRDDIVQIVREVARFHVPFITTNGWFVTAELARALFRAGLWGVSVSLDYADPALHDKRRAHPGAFEHAVQALEHFQRARLHRWQRVNVMTVLLHDNLEQIEPLLRLAAYHRAYLTVQPYGILKTGSTLFSARQPDVARRLLDLKRRYRNFLSNPHFLSRFDQALTAGVPGCRAGRASFSIDPAGYVAICVEHHSRPIGNIHRDHTQQLIRRLRQAAAVNRCSQCWYNCRGEVEMLYHPPGLLRSLPNLLFDRGQPAIDRSIDATCPAPPANATNPARAYV